MNVHKNTIFRHWTKTKTTINLLYLTYALTHRHTYDTHSVIILSSKELFHFWTPDLGISYEYLAHTRTHSQRLLSNGNANLWQNQIGITKTSAGRRSGTLGRVGQIFVLLLWLSLLQVFYKSINQQLVPINHAYSNDNNNNELLYPISYSFNRIPFLT